MNTLESEIRRLRDDDPELALALDVFDQIDRVYREALEAMGESGGRATDVMNSAEWTTSFRSTFSSSDG